jgi:ankyrin repeat protein
MSYIPEDTLLYEINNYLTIYDVINISQLNTEYYNLITNKYKITEEQLYELYEIRTDGQGKWFDNYYKIFDNGDLSKENVGTILCILSQFNNNNINNIIIKLFSTDLPSSYIVESLVNSIKSGNNTISTYITNNYDVFEMYPDDDFIEDPISIAIKYNLTNIFFKLMGSEYLDNFIGIDWCDFEDYFYESIKNNNITIFKYVFDKFNYAFIIYNNNYRLSSSYKLYECAIENESCDIAEFLLDYDSFYAYHVFDIPCINGDYDMVKLFLDKGINPCGKDNMGFRTACKYGHTNIVKLLLKWNETQQDDKIELSTQNNYALQHAVENKHYDIVDLLLENNISFDKNLYSGFVEDLIVNNKCDIIKKLHINGLNLDQNDNLFFREALHNSKPNIIEYLLDNIDIPNENIIHWRSLWLTDNGYDSYEDILEYEHQHIYLLLGEYSSKEGSFE